MSDPKPENQEKTGNTVKVLAVVIPALVAVVFMLKGPIERWTSKDRPGSDAPDAVQYADAFQRCIGDSLKKKEETKDKGSLDFSGLKTEQDGQRAIENADLTPEERKQLFSDCRSLFPSTANIELNAKLTLVEGENKDPVFKDVRVSIEAGSRYVEPGSNGEAVVPYNPSTCGKSGCKVTIEASSAYELVEPTVLDKDTLARGETIKLRRKSQSLVIALGNERKGTPYIWIVGTNDGALLWNADCQPNDTTARCRRLQAEDGSARFNARGSLSSVTVQLSGNGVDWNEEQIVIDDVPSKIQNGILTLPAPTTSSAGGGGGSGNGATPCATSDAKWFAKKVRSFNAWKETRTLTVTATLGAGGVTKLAATPPFVSDAERDALSRSIGAPSGLKPNCTPATVRAEGIHARAQQ